MVNRKVIIGLDGVPYDLIKALANKGDIPNISSLIKEGYFSKMRAAIPEVSNVNWSSIVTGKNPGEHGIFGFTELIPGTYSVSFPDRRALKTDPFWTDGNNRYVILNVPAMYPAPEIDGYFISGFVSPELKRAVTPSSELKNLEEINYRVDVDSEKAHKSKSLFLDELFETLEIREKAYRHYWEKDWDYFMLVFTGTDRLEHFLLDAYHDEEHEHHDRFIQYFKEIDRIIGDIVDKMNEEDRLMMLSDHGMELIEQNVNVNKVLEDNGLLTLGDKPKKRYKNIQRGTKAFALDPGRIYLHRQDRYPRGEVEDGEGIIEEIIDIFQNLRYEGENVIKEVHRRDKIYHGKQSYKAPDIVLTPNEGFNLKGSVKYEAVYEQNIFNGKHTEDDAFIYCNNLTPPKNPTVEDVRGLIERDENE
ncbi:MAG: alkaline phosphatase family protein [Thermoplasmatota archaeon]